MKIIKVVDCKNKEVIRIKIEIDKNMFIVVPDIVDNKFNYLGNKLMGVRHKYVQKYVNKNFLTYEELEYKIKDEMFNILTNECENLHRTDGVMYYTIIGG